MAARAVPERLRWAVELLDVAPDDELLEIGCGRGVAVELICAKLDRGKITAIDRSATMTAAAEQRNAEHVAAGRALIRTTDLAAADLPRGAFDKVFAINVNLFWVRSPQRELDLIKSVLKPSGALRVFYEPPDAARADDLADKVTTALSAGGFSTTTSTATTQRSASLLCVTGRPS